MIIVAPFPHIVDAPCACAWTSTTQENTETTTNTSKEAGHAHAPPLKSSSLSSTEALGFHPLS
eukprot:434146-Amphidinium_carterae.1